jgi:hypothetical protein
VASAILSFPSIAGSARAGGSPRPVQRLALLAASVPRTEVPVVKVGLAGSVACGCWSSTSQRLHRKQGANKHPPSRHHPQLSTSVLSSLSLLPLLLLAEGSRTLQWQMSHDAPEARTRAGRNWSSQVSCVHRAQFAGQYASLAACANCRAS